MVVVCCCLLAVSDGDGVEKDAGWGTEGAFAAACTIPADVDGYFRIR
jgi:hypothetical protein